MTVVATEDEDSEHDQRSVCERANSTSAKRRLQLAQEILEQREDEVLDLHTARSAHYIDNAFSLVTANMAVVSLVLGCVFMSRPCEKPLASFLVGLGMLAPFAACLPVLVRQWFYLHLRLKNVVTVLVLLTSALYVAWLLVGQRWAFASSAKTCDADLSTAANVVVFVLYLMLLLYAAKVVWYLALRVRYSYKQLFISCLHDPYPNALAMTDLELDQLEIQLDECSPPKPTPKNHVLLDLQRHKHEIHQNLHRLFHAHTPLTDSATDASKSKVQPATFIPDSVVSKPWALDVQKTMGKKAKNQRSTIADNRSPADSSARRSKFARKHAK